MILIECLEKKVMKVGEVKIYKVEIEEEEDKNHHLVIVVLKMDMMNIWEENKKQKDGLNNNKIWKNICNGQKIINNINQILITFIDK